MEWLAMGHGLWAMENGPWGMGMGMGMGMNGKGMPTPMQPAVQIPASPPLSFFSRFGSVRGCV